MTTMGKYRHLSRTATSDGHFVILAIDHRANLLELLNRHAPAPLTDGQFGAFKRMVLSTIGSRSSAVLTDPAYGIGTGITSGVISGQIGLLAPLEVTNYDVHPSRRTLQFIPDWSVRKIKMVGGDGVKLLLPYHPRGAHVDEQYATVRQIVDDCACYDIPFFLEPIPYSLDPAVPLTNGEHLQICIDMCRTFSDIGVDVLKLPFPLDPKQNSNEDDWLDACRQINAACSVPWALLSAGVDYEIFLKQSRIACLAGASGVIVGRAVWAEAVELEGLDRSDFLRGEAVRRLDELGGVCAFYAAPWYQRVEPPPGTLDWYESYPD